jgi:hypothetical protein
MKFVSTTFILLLFAIFITPAQAQLSASTATNLTDEEAIEKNILWMKAKIEKYGGKASNEYAYFLNYQKGSCEFSIEQRSLSGDANQNFTFTMKLKDFKQVRLDGPDLEILANGASVIGEVNGKRSAWWGIRIYRFREGETGLVGRMNETMNELAAASGKKCGE